MGAGVRQLCHPCPGDPILVAATPQRAPPEVSDMVPEHVPCARIGRHCVVVEVAADDPPQPLSLLGIGWCNHCHQGSRDTHYQAGAAPYLHRTSTGWIAPACLAHSLNHLIGASEDRRRDGKAERLRGLEINY